MRPIKIHKIIFEDHNNAIVTLVRNKRKGVVSHSDSVGKVKACKIIP